MSVTEPQGTNTLFVGVWERGLPDASNSVSDTAWVRPPARSGVIPVPSEQGNVAAMPSTLMSTSSPGRHETTTPFSVMIHSAATFAAQLLEPPPPQPTAAVETAANTTSAMRSPCRVMSIPYPLSSSKRLLDCLIIHRRIGGPISRELPHVRVVHSRRQTPPYHSYP